MTLTRRIVLFLVLTMSLACIGLLGSDRRAVAVEIAPCADQGLGAGCVSPQVIQRSVCDNQPGLCKPQTASVVYIACGATLSNSINSSSPAGTVYQLAGNAISPCTWSSQAALTPHANITIQGDCASPIGAYTIIDGGSANHTFINGSATNGITLKCLTVSHFYTYSVSCGSSGPAITTSDGWVIRNSSIANNGCMGVRAQGATQIINNYIGHNGVVGVQPTQGDSSLTGSAATILVLGNEFDANGNVLEVNGTSAGVKIIQDSCPTSATMPIDSVSVLSNYVHDTVGTGAATGGVGIWADCHATNILIQGNTVVRSGYANIMCEISVGCEISHNYVADGLFNDTSRTNTFPGACFYISSAVGVNLHDNYCALNPTYGYVAVAVKAQCRSENPTATPTFFPNYSNIQVHHNTIVVPAFSSGSYGYTGADDLTTTANATTSFGNLCSAGLAKAAVANWYTFSNNVYYLQSATSASFHQFTCTSSEYTLAQVQNPAGLGSGCAFTINVPQELGSMVIAGSNNTTNKFMAAIPGCFALASAGDFCDSRSWPW